MTVTMTLDSDVYKCLLLRLFEPPLQCEEIQTLQHLSKTVILVTFGPKMPFISPQKCGRSSNHVWEKWWRGRAGGRAGAGAAVQKDPFIPIRRVRCRPQRNPMEPDTIHTILSSPNPRDIHLQIHQELGRSIYTCKLLSWVLKFLLISSQLNLGSSSCNTQVPQK